MSTSHHNPPRPSYSSANTLENSSDGSSFHDVNGSSGSGTPSRRQSNKKENQFIYSHGSKLHAYGRDKAPYPFSYNREVLELWCLDHALQYSLQHSATFVNLNGVEPKRCLDVGTGLGDWVIDAARRWTQTTFVGYDLVNVQIPLHCVESQVANRIEWVYGNILRQRLPFEDEEFDHIHIQSMAFSVPELKWPAVFEEIHRVLKPGGTVEMIEEDAVFPTLPKWFTGPLHAQAKRPAVHLPDGSQRPLFSSRSSPHPHPHDHALLEILFGNVFENRFLNRVPSSVFSRVQSPPTVAFPMPPFAPLTPLPGELGSASSSTLSNDDEPSSLFLPEVSQDSRLSTSSRSPGPDSSSTLVDNDYVLATEFIHIDLNRRSLSTLNGILDESEDSSSTSSKHQRRSIATVMVDDIHDRIGGASALELIAFRELEGLDEESLFMHLYRGVGSVLATREAMWDELMELIKNEPETLEAHGWEAGDFTDAVARPKFDALVDRYKGDMHVRMSLWHSLTKHGWPYPQRDPLSKAELVEEERLRRAIMEARKSASEDEAHSICRSTRLLVGMKKAN
ncbi:S-adenosyl-L-methionine-dependent methyltransferase [Cristinia sonorae]|uniref:S-adenosyl-L-methionine-dependent methyltransferase n=1 Tax=Cristinia sonorae TaxID=1940300 RepID=A0A8K0UMD1_9AGAR|nr:S-adenosyl-L-methionine-dependent methyltransferase [Cristinia sonorae]